MLALSDGVSKTNQVKRRREDHMADQERDDRQSTHEQDDYMKRGKGGKDEVGRSGIYRPRRRTRPPTPKSGAKVNS